MPNINNGGPSKHRLPGRQSFAPPPPFALSVAPGFALPTMLALLLPLPLMLVLLLALLTFEGASRLAFAPGVGGCACARTAPSRIRQTM